MKTVLIFGGGERVFMKKRDWKKINNRLIAQGTIWVDLRFLENRKEELAAMNEGKEGARYEYPDSLIRYAGSGNYLVL